MAWLTLSTFGKYHGKGLIFFKSKPCLKMKTVVIFQQLSCDTFLHPGRFQRDPIINVLRPALKLS
jgi:hypothetical protein